MLKICVLMYSILMFADAASAGGDAMQSPDVLVQTLENHYRDLIDLTATVTQKNNLKSIGKTQKYEGTLSIKKPGQLRLDYTNGQRIVIDGKEAWFYSQKSEQVIKRSFTDFEHANIPVAFLLGAATVGKDFQVSTTSTPRMLELVPKKTDAVMKKLRVRIDESGRVTELFIFDPSGNTTEIRFTDIRENTGLSDSLFRFSVPKGTEIIEQ